MELPDNAIEVVHRKLGEGTFARVYEVTLTIDGRPERSAKKIVVSGAKDMWQEEVKKNMEVLGLPNIVQMLYFKYLAGRPKTYEEPEVAPDTEATKSTGTVNLGGGNEGHGVIYFELCKNRSLEKYMDSEKREPLTEETKVNMCKDIACGLLNLHSKKIGHADLEPRNVMVTGQGEMKIGDLGCSTWKQGPGDTCLIEDVKDLTRLFIFIMRGKTFKRNDVGPEYKGLKQSLPPAVQACLAKMLPETGE